MFKTKLNLLMMIFVQLFILAGCVISNGHINVLNHGDPNRVAGAYPGKPDADGIVTFHAIGKGLPPETATSKGQAILLAERAAVADGYRKLAEKVYGVYIDSHMKMGNNIVDFDSVWIEVQTWLRGAEVLGIVHREDDITEAHMQLNVYIPPEYKMSLKVMQNY